MAFSHETGKDGELEAALFLEEKGMIILEKNWRAGHLEIDIVAMDGDVLVVVEVKTRATNEFGEPETFVNPAKQKKLIKAANSYLEKSGAENEVRFDVVSIVRKGSKIVHIPDAFSPTVG